MRNGRQNNLALIADDDALVRKALVGSLAELSHCVETDDGQRLVEIYREHIPDILFLDIHLPAVNGLDLIGRIKAIDKDAYIIMLTADSTKDNVKKAISCGASGFMAKPFVKETLMANFHRCPTIRSNPDPKSGQ